MGRKSKTDPTGQASNRKKATKRLDSRLRKARREILQLFAKVPRTRSIEKPVVNQVVYSYDLTPEQQENLSAEIAAALALALETTEERVPADWFYSPSVELPYRQGTQEEIISFNQMVAAAVLAGAVTSTGLPPQRIPPEVVLSSPNYRAGVKDAYVRNYGLIKTLGEKTAGQVYERINSGMAAGVKPTSIAGDIKKRFDVSSANAKRIVDTETNKAFNDAKTNMVEMAAEETGLTAGVIHISALLPTTRDTHAARHGNAYTVRDQNAWWDTGANRINCKCSVQSVLIDSSGRVVQKEERDQIRQEGKEFFA